MILNKNGVVLHWENMRILIGIPICYIKIIKFCTETIKIHKNSRLAAGPLSGITLGGEQSPTVR